MAPNWYDALTSGIEIAASKAAGAAVGVLCSRMKLEGAASHDTVLAELRAAFAAAATAGFLQAIADFAAACDQRFAAIDHDHGG